MNKLTTLLSFIFISVICFGQAPEAFKYQAVARDASGTIIANGVIGLKINIKSTSPNGTTVYSETHSTTSSIGGVVNIDIGSGSIVSGTFSGIDWSSNSYYLNIEMDANGGTAYTDMGTSQLMSVPYALYAKTSGGASTPTYAVGDQALGGVVFYVNSTGTHGLVASVADIGSINPVTWYKAQTEIDQQLSSPFATPENEYTDWKVPSWDQLYVLWENRVIVGNFCNTCFYWSSTGESATDALAVYFNGTGSEVSAPKTNTMRIRAIRSF